METIMSFDWKKPTAVLPGRFQPFHQGHKALFLEALKKTGQVAIFIRDVGGIDEKNPFDFEEVKKRIEENLQEYAEQFIVMKIPNMKFFLFGRDVGYQIEKIELTPELEAISATKIRKEMVESGKLI